MSTMRRLTSLFDLMDREFKMLKMPVYLTMGNHENVGITAESGIDKTNPMWGKKMYESRYRNGIILLIIMDGNSLFWMG